MTKAMREWSILEWLGLVTGVMGVIGGFYGAYLFVGSKVQDQRIQIPIYSGYVHLGDNTLANIGGEVAPKTPVPGAEDLDSILVYDKTLKSFGSYNGFPTEVLQIVRYYEDQFEPMNFEAFKHIKLVTGREKIPNDYIGQTVDIGGGALLVWQRDAGNFYYDKAPIALTKTVNVYKFLLDSDVDPDSATIKNAYFHFYGSHSGRRNQQNENIDVIVNGIVHSLPFKSVGVRPEEVVKIELSEQIFSDLSTASTRFTVMVLPFEERYPVAPKGWPEQRGPAHFRDIEIWDLKLELVLD